MPEDPIPDSLRSPGMLFDLSAASVSSLVKEAELSMVP